MVIFINPFENILLLTFIFFLVGEAKNQETVIVKMTLAENNPTMIDMLKNQPSNQY